MIEFGKHRWAGVELRTPWTISSTYWYDGDRRGISIEYDNQCDDIWFCLNMGYTANYGHQLIGKQIWIRDWINAQIWGPSCQTIALCWPTCCVCVYQCTLLQHTTYLVNMVSRGWIISFFCFISWYFSFGRETFSLGALQQRLLKQVEEVDMDPMDSQFPVGKSVDLVTEGPTFADVFIWSCLEWSWTLWLKPEQTASTESFGWFPGIFGAGISPALEIEDFTVFPCFPHYAPFINSHNSPFFAIVSTRRAQADGDGDDPSRRRHPREWMGNGWEDGKRLQKRMGRLMEMVNDMEVSKFFERAEPRSWGSMDRF